MSDLGEHDVTTQCMLMAERLGNGKLALEAALEEILNTVDDVRVVDRLKEIERIATKALLIARGGLR
jgi:hypothetical protein